MEQSGKAVVPSTCRSIPGGLDQPWLKTSDKVFLKETNDSVGIGTSSPKTNLDVQGGMRFKRTAVSGTYAIKNDDFYIGITSGSTTVTLPSASSVGAGRMFIIKSEGTFLTVTLEATGSETIDLLSSILLSSSLSPVRIISDGTNWWTI